MQKIFRFEPIYKEKIWGGRKLEKYLNRKIPEGKIGESWEISDYGNDLSVIINGEFKGKTLKEIFNSHKIEIFGEAFLKEKSFPLLVKIIDSEDKLSVQVHPDDEYTTKKDPENSGKKESWLILDSEENAEIVCGFKTELNREKYKELIESNSAETPLQSFKVQKGDAFIINPGTVHAIGAGNLLLEVQQSSDSTYRVYDYGRLGDDGKPRDLHLEKALDVLNFQKSDGSEKLSPKEMEFQGAIRKLFISNDKFHLETLEFEKEVGLPKISNNSSFIILYILNGEILVDGENISQGETILISAVAVKENLSLFPKLKSTVAIMTAGSDWLDFKI
ncbi:MAG: class I mannose-6-phosphate isomerase [Leptospiraceae bacterium]|nr:class I mannose-6-phosphate isomerase [Leptospiraceae bacterium]